MSLPIKTGLASPSDAELMRYNQQLRANMGGSWFSTMHARVLSELVALRLKPKKKAKPKTEAAEEPAEA